MTAMAGNFYKMCILLLISFLAATRLSLASSLSSVNRPSIRWTQAMLLINFSVLVTGYGFANKTEQFSTHKEEDCYPWMFRNKTSGECECSDIPYRAVLCDPTIPRTSILDCYCMTYNTERNETELGRCLFGCSHKKDTLYNKLPQNLLTLNSKTCAKANRTSTLCGMCKPGYSPLVYSFDMNCMNCTGMNYNWIKYIAVAYIPLTFFFVFVVIFRFSGTSPLVRGFIATSQGLVSPAALRAYMTYAHNNLYIEILIKTTFTFYGIWNLDFFRTVISPLCLNISPLQALALDYAIAFYPLLLVLVTYILIRLHSHDIRIVVWLWKPFHKVFRLVKKEWNLEGSVVQAFATFFLLSYLKILNTTFDLLIYTEVYTLPLGEQQYQVKHVLYYDASVEYFGGEHLYYGIVAILVGTFTTILPLVFLVIYPMRWFQKCLNYFKVHRQGIDMFVNCYQGYYKDGTNGTHDFRCFSVVSFLLQLISLGLFTLCKSMFCYSLLTLLAVLSIFTILAIQPYKPQFKAYSVIDAFLGLILAIIFTLITALDEATLKDSMFSTPSYIILGIAVVVPSLYFVGLTVWWVFLKKKICPKLNCLQVRAVDGSCSNDDFPVQRENEESQTFQPQAAPLLSVSQEKYGSIP